MTVYQPSYVPNYQPGTLKQGDATGSVCQYVVATNGNNDYEAPLLPTTSILQVKATNSSFVAAFTLPDGQYDGQIVTIAVIDSNPQDPANLNTENVDNPTAINIIPPLDDITSNLGTAGHVIYNLFPNEAKSFVWDANFWGDTPGSGSWCQLYQSQTTSVTYTLDQNAITNMHGTPIQLFPSTNFAAVIIESIEIYRDFAGTPYGGGGQVTVYYSSAFTESSTTIAQFNGGVINGGVDTGIANFSLRPSCYDQEQAQIGTPGFEIFSENASQIFLTAAAEFTGSPTGDHIKLKINFKTLAFS